MGLAATLMVTPVTVALDGTQSLTGLDSSTGLTSSTITRLAMTPGSGCPVSPTGTISKGSGGNQGPPPKS
jgi:hypothetical protein